MKKMFQYAGFLFCANFLLSTPCVAELTMPAPHKSAWHQPGFGVIQDKGPKITIIFMADSAPKESIDMVNNFLTGGIGFLKHNGYNYQNVMNINANPSSAQGYSMLSTGTFPLFHGMVNNNWIAGDGQGGTPGYSFFNAQQDQDLATAGVWDPVNIGNVYNVTTLPTYPQDPIAVYYPNLSGVSARNFKVDTISDQLILFSTPQLPTKVYSIAIDSEPSALLAGHLGKAIWADNVTGLFTTSKYYFPDGIPNWVQTFNTVNPIPLFTIWGSAYPAASAAYQFPNAQNTTYQMTIPLPFPAVSIQGSYFGLPILSNIPFFLGSVPFLVSPAGIKYYFDFVKYFFETQVDPKSEERTVLWLNSTAYDLVAHLNGSQSENTIDSLYHLDRNLGDLLSFVYKKYGKDNCLFVFLSDHGTYHAIPELLNEVDPNLNLAMRTVVGYPPGTLPNQPTDLIEVLNAALQAELSVPFDYVWAILPPFIYMNYDVFYDSTYTPDRDAVLQVLKNILLQQPGIKNAWTADELYTFPFEREDMERHHKLHLYRDLPIESAHPVTVHQERRSGEIVFIPQPWNMMTGSSTGLPNPYKGAYHEDPFSPDTRMPLYIYQHGKYAKKLFTESLIPQQFAITLAGLLGVPRPTAAPYEVQPLPGIIPPRN